MHRAHVSPQADLIELYRTLNQPRRVRKANRKMMRLHPGRFAGRADLLTFAERLSIREDYEASNSCLCKRWFPNRVQLFDLTDPLSGSPAHDAVAAFTKNIQCYLILNMGSKKTVFGVARGCIEYDLFKERLGLEILLNLVACIENRITSR